MTKCAIGIIITAAAVVLPAVGQPPYVMAEYNNNDALSDRSKFIPGTNQVKNTEYGTTSMTYRTVVILQSGCNIENSNALDVYDTTATDMDYILEFTVSENSTDRTGIVLEKNRGTFDGPSGHETWYDLPMQGVIRLMRARGYSEDKYPYWIRDDGVKMFSDYVMISANLDIRPKGTILETSLGTGMVCDTGSFIEEYPYGLDIAVDWKDFNKE